MKKLLCVLLVVVLSLGIVLTGCQTKQSSGLAEVKKKGKLVVGIDPAFPPMGFVDENSATVGLDIDLAKAVCAKLGVEAVIQPIDWTVKEIELDSKNIDCIWNGYTITDKRKNMVLFSDPYLTNRQIIIVKIDSTISTKSDLTGVKNIGIQNGSTAVDAIEADTLF